MIIAVWQEMLKSELLIKMPSGGLSGSPERAMKYRIVFDNDALSDLAGIRTFERRAITDLIQKFLGDAPTRVSQTRIKRLRGYESPQYRLRVGDFRVLYDVIGDEVLVLRVLAKSDVAEYLREMGREIKDSDSGTTGS